MTKLQQTILSILAYQQELPGQHLLSLDFIHGQVCGYDWQGAVQRHGPSRQSVLQCLQRMATKQWVRRSRDPAPPGLWCLEYDGREALREYAGRA